MKNGNAAEEDPSEWASVVQSPAVFISCDNLKFQFLLQHGILRAGVPPFSHIMMSFMMLYFQRVASYDYICVYKVLFIVLLYV